MLTATTPCIPSTLSPAGAVHPGQLYAFLVSLRHNNVLLVDRDRKLLDRITKAVTPHIASLPGKYQKNVEAMICALPHLRTIIAQPFVTLAPGDTDGSATSAMILKSVASFGCDAVVTFPPTTSGSVRTHLGPLATEVVDVNDYSLCECEQQRVRFTELIALARRSREDIVRLLRCATRFTRHISLYDRYVGAHMPGLANTDEDKSKDATARQRFAKSIGFFLRLWREARGATDGELFADVYTTVDASRLQSLPRQRGEDFVTGVAAWQEEVMRLSGVGVNIFFKRSMWEVPHDRYIDTEQCTIAAPGGLDVVRGGVEMTDDDIEFQAYKNIQFIHGDDVPYELETFRDAQTAKNAAGRLMRFGFPGSV